MLEGVKNAMPILLARMLLFRDYVDSLHDVTFLSAL
jgi:hypothetical protein